MPNWGHQHSGGLEKGACTNRDIPAPIAQRVNHVKGLDSTRGPVKGTQPRMTQLVQNALRAIQPNGVMNLGATGHFLQ